MASTNAVEGAVLERLRAYDTCTICNAIESFEVRLRNTGFTNDTIRCRFPDLPPMVGYAATARLRTATAPMGGGHFLQDRSAWWTSILAVPAPRIVVLEDRDDPPGLGAFLGDVHAAILHALGCIGYVTNGSVRELPRVRAMGLQLFSAAVAVSHGYAHLFDLGVPVTVGGLEIHSGDLLHGDQHGIVQIPAAIAAQVPAVAEARQRREMEVVDYCLSEGFDLDQLRSRIRRGLERSQP